MKDVSRRIIQTNPRPNVNDEISGALSRLKDYFMKNKEENFVSAVVAGPRKREVGLVVQAKFSAYTVFGGTLIRVRGAYCKIILTRGSYLARGANFVIYGI